MYSHCAASSSRRTSRSFWCTSQEPQPFPTSNVRSSTELPSSPRCTPPKHTTEHAANYLASTCYPTTVPRRIQVEPGVWSDGTDRILSAAYPPVANFLNCARDALRLPPAPSEVVFALAALEVFYSPGDPVHWMFWSDEKKYQTARVVTPIALHRPQLIQSNVAWNGTPEYLSILASHHGPTWRHLYESQPWFSILVPPKPTIPVKVMNLRKRKPAQEPLCEAPKSVDDDEEAEMEEPPRKRPKPGRRITVAAASEPKSNSRDFPILQNCDDPASFLSQPEDISSTIHDDDDISPPQDDKPDHEAFFPTKKNARGRRNSTHRSPSPELHSYTPIIPTFHTPITSTHSRNRSTSQASALTLVGQRRSTSVLSAATAVEASNPTQVKASEIVGDGDEQADDIDDKVSVADTEASVVSIMLTRSRTTTARKAAAHAHCLATKAGGRSEQGQKGSKRVVRVKSTPAPKGKQRKKPTKV